MFLIIFLNFSPYKSTGLNSLKKHLDTFHYSLLLAIMLEYR